MVDRKKQRESEYDNLLKRGLILSENGARALNMLGRKTALIGFETGGNYLVKFDPKSLTSFLEELKNSRQIDPSTIHFTEIKNLITDDRPLFMAMTDRRDLPTIEDAIFILNEAPFLSRTASYISRKVR
jgi:hypothetical protein